MPPNRSWACCTAEATCSGLVTSSPTASTRSGAVSARSATLPTSRAVTTALWPAPMTASASERPSPVEQPVMSQVDICNRSFPRWPVCRNCRSAAPGLATLEGVGDTLYATCGELSLAYQVFGDGPIELAIVGPFATHVELFWTQPEFKAFFDQLATFCRVLLFDKAGVGLSDPVPRVRTLDERATEIEAVMDAAGFSQAALLGLSEGGPAAIAFAATRPRRTRALILCSTFSYIGMVGWDEVDGDPAELRARVLPELGEEYTPSEPQIMAMQGFAHTVRSSWGSGAALKGLIPSVGSMRQLGMLERMGASPGMARATLEAMFRIDVRPILPTITTPT